MQIVPMSYIEMTGLRKKGWMMREELHLIELIARILADEKQISAEEQLYILALLKEEQR